MQSVFVKVFLVIIVASFGCFILVKLWFNNWINEQLARNLDSVISIYTLIFGILFLILFMFLTSFNLRKQISNIGNLKS